MATDQCWSAVAVTGVLSHRAVAVAHLSGSCFRARRVEQAGHYVFLCENTIIRSSLYIDIVCLATNSSHQQNNSKRAVISYEPLVSTTTDHTVEASKAVLMQTGTDNITHYEWNCTPVRETRDIRSYLTWGESNPFTALWKT